MNTYTRPLLAAICAATALSIAVASAPARNFSIRILPLRAIWASLEFKNTINSTVVRCPVTLEGSFSSRTISKAVAILLGVTTRAELASASCTGGHATVHRETLPWRRTYEFFIGRLPRVTEVGILLLRDSYSIEFSGITCNMQTEELHPSEASIDLDEAGQATGIRMHESGRIPLTVGLCALGEASLSGTSGPVEDPADDADITIELI